MWGDVLPSPFSTSGSMRAALPFMGVYNCIKTYKQSLFDAKGDPKCLLMIPVITAIAAKDNCRTWKEGICMSSQRDVWNTLTL